MLDPEIEEDPEVSDLHDRLDRQAMVMARMLDDLHDTARIASGNAKQARMPG